MGACYLLSGILVGTVICRTTATESWWCVLAIPAAWLFLAGLRREGK